MFFHENRPFTGQDQLSCHNPTGFVGVVPALALLKEDEGRIELTVSQNMLWALSITFFGLFCAVPLRKQTVVLTG